MSIITPLTSEEAQLLYDVIPNTIRTPLARLNYLQTCNNNNIKKLLHEKEAAVMLQLLSNGSYIQTALPITDHYQIINETYINNQYDMAQLTYIKNIKTDHVFNLTMVDLYQDTDDMSDDMSEDESMIHFISSYLYGNPYSEDYQEKKVSYIKHMDKIIQEELDQENKSWNN